MSTKRCGFAAVALVSVATLLSIRTPLLSVRPEIRQDENEAEMAEQQLDYKTLVDIWNDLSNFHLFFKSLIFQTRFQGQKKIVEEGYVKISSSVKKLMNMSRARRKARLDEISDFIRRKIQKLQNPKNCSKAKVLVSSISRQRCGFGCTLHSVVSFLLEAFVANRTFVLQSKGWKYAREGWEYAFMPVSSCTSDHNLSVVLPMEDDTKHDRVLKFGNLPETGLHWSVPKDMKDELSELHGHPFAWWIAQFTSYVFQMQPSFERKLQQIAKKIGFSENLVGIQVRWGDKIQLESNKHQVEEYMDFIEEYYKGLEMQGQNVERKVYLATEEAAVWVELWRKYPQYKFLGSGRANFDPDSRYSHEGLTSVVIDIYLLSRCRYVVCTLSSSVCRTAYELLIANHIDGSTRFRSVDALYRFKVMKEQPWTATLHHEAASPDELDLKPGDNILTSLDPHLPFNDGFLRGKNLRTLKEGKFPIFKAREELFSYQIPD